MPDPSGTDPYTATREQWTAGLVSRPVPPDASRNYRDYVEPLKDLLNLLTHHEAMRPNLQQTYMTPANSKNRVYFMWDFIGRTLGWLYNIPPATEWLQLQAPFKELAKDVRERSMLATTLILNPQDGILNQMVEMSYPGCAARGHPDFGEPILEQARILQQTLLSGQNRAGQ